MKLSLADYVEHYYPGYELLSGDDAYDYCETFFTNVGIVFDPMGWWDNVEEMLPTNGNFLLQTYTRNDKLFVRLVPLNNIDLLAARHLPLTIEEP
jgi:hypothetical protein